jgi:shikimate kinase
MLNFKRYLDEGRNDPGIFHAIFMAGGPGSGKSFVATGLGLRSLGFVDINSDKAFEMGLKKSLLSLKMPDSEEYPRNIVRDLAKKTTKAKYGHAIDGRLAMVVDGTGKNVRKMGKNVKDLELLGYETAMVFVNTDLETALERNEKRERSLKPAVVTKMWKQVQSNLKSFKTIFGTRLFVIDNSNYEVSGVQSAKVYTKIMAWAKQLPDNPAVKNWMENQ